MNPNELLRIVDSLHREKNIDPEIVFQAIEAALVSAAKRQYGEESDITVRIAREDGAIQATLNGEDLDPEEMIGRIGAQTAKQVIIQKIREAERDSLIEEFQQQIGHLVMGIAQRNEGGATTVSLGNVEALLPKSEQIPGETHHVNQRVRAVVYEVRPQGSRVKVVLSRKSPQLVKRLFEQEIPEISEGVITVNAMSREPGYRSKVAVSSTDQRVDCVGACVGVRGNRIKNIVDELAGERIDIVRWDDDPEVLIPNALQPAEVDQVLLCDMIGRAIVLVREDQLPLAIGRRGQNVRLASKLCGWDIEIMTAEELDEQIERAVMGFSELEGVSEELAQRLVEQGYLSYDDLSVIEPDALVELSNGELTMEQVEAIGELAEVAAEEAEVAAKEEARRQREQERLEQQQAEATAAAQAAAVQAAAAAAAKQPETASEATSSEGVADAGEAAAADEAATDEAGTEQAADEAAVEAATDEAGTEQAADEAAEAAANEAGAEQAGDESAPEKAAPAQEAAAAEEAAADENQQQAAASSEAEATQAAAEPAGQPQRPTDESEQTRDGQGNEQAPAKFGEASEQAEESVEQQQQAQQNLEAAEHGETGSGSETP